MTGQTLDVLGPEYEVPEATGVDGEVWVYVLPDDFMDALTRLSAKGRRTVAKAWCNSDELDRDLRTVEDTDALLAEVISLAKQAVLERKRLMVRMSL